MIIRRTLVLSCATGLLAAAAHGALAAPPSANDPLAIVNAMPVPRLVLIGFMEAIV